jgi:shikimate kinase
MDYNPFNIANPNHIFVLCGPAGTGKTTIGEYLAAVKGWTFLEEDNVCLLDS